ncbi:hypothetical protein [Chryseobacterium indologenes]|uniref:hypothetical protein n=1 Tax=Chryseobacterium indologenes TaxID=253 RepID=UPI001D0CF0B2|nr:hypothetical protein [Chryseobacterium indologenes]UDQ54626.1 hypothetical protein LJF28_02885 [Chryseobacterium indologenes]
MKNATQNPIGNHSTARRKKTKATAPTAKGVRTMDASAQRQFGNTERPTEICSRFTASDAFLKTCFIPLLKENDITAKQSQRRIAKTERDFYKSLSQLAEHYDIQPMPTRHFGYPYNVRLALMDVQKQLKGKTENWAGVRLIDKNGKTNFTVEERCNTGATLFYIPVVPLYRLLRQKTRRKAGCLLLSVCSYLYRNARIPYYRIEDSYLYWNYEILTDWMEQDAEMEDYFVCKKELYRAELIGDVMGQKISDPRNLQFFEQRLKGFNPKDQFDKACFELAKKVFALYSQYPDESIFRNAHHNNAIDPETRDENGYNDYNEENVVTMDKYISFFAEGEGVVYDNLVSMINNEFNEYAEAQEPIIFKTFDGNSLLNESLDFENNLFKVLNELCRLLN